MNNKIEFCKTDLQQIINEKKANSICNRLAKSINYKLQRNGSSFHQVRYFNLDDAITYFMKPLDPKNMKYKENREYILSILFKLKEDIVE